jgi:hypothetical protein
MSYFSSSGKGFNHARDCWNWVSLDGSESDGVLFVGIDRPARD